MTPDQFAERAGFWPASIPRIAQGAGDIAIRMTRAFEAMPPGPAVLVGADIPALTRGRIAEAFRLLRRSDLVFGPSSDGGFWLVGTRQAISIAVSNNKAEQRYSALSQRLREAQRGPV